MYRSFAPPAAALLKLGTTCVLQVARRSFSSDDFAATAPRLLVLERIRRSEQAVVSRQQLQSIMHSCQVLDESQQAKLIESLTEAAVTVSVDGGAHFHLRPAQLLADIAHGTENTAKQHPLLDSATRVAAAAEQERAAMLEELREPISAAARWRKCMWAGAFLWASSQLAIISRLTFFDLDWDIMEPVSYFLGTGTSLVFFGYVLRYHREHTYEGFDERFLPARVRKYTKPGFDWKKFEDVCSRVEASDAEIKRLKKWLSEN